MKAKTRHSRERKGNAGRMTHLQRVMAQPHYILLSLLLSGGMLALYVYTQVIGNVNNIDVWAANLQPVRGLLLVIFSMLFGLTTTYQIHVWTTPQTCSLVQKTKGTGMSGLSTIGLFLVAQCPACASLGVFFLPLSAVTFLGEYAEWINILGIGLLVFTLHYLGAFERVK
ncbi:MAG: hypothetical protein FJY86_04310 [Candidatus Diapherotrites archaeon]|uniref:Uncharacterized protein n=1 Tax=Candidatus Iainarchaeum sp. TaxID=3101447 RepID=A0A8T4C7W0_9ARCH|nr:hypothetical protein [Candidatus Diapherotrites archaeon]